MSAFIVHPFHISTLVAAAIRRNRKYRMVDFNGEPVDYQNATQVGYALLAANILSVQTRYDDCTYEELPGPVPTPNADDYQYRHTDYYPTDPVKILKAISCYRYQSCEYDGFEQSAAAKFCDDLRDALIDSLPGYDDAAWELMPPAVPERLGRAY